MYKVLTTIVNTLYILQPTSYFNINILYILLYKTAFRGGFSRGAHLFPFRTQKLSPLAPMVLRKRESRSPPVFLNLNHLVD